MASLDQLRADYHATLIRELWGQRNKPRTTTPWYTPIADSSRPVWNNADGYNDVSVVYCDGVASRVGVPVAVRTGPGGSTSGGAFERATSRFIADALDVLSHLNVRRLIATPPATHFPSAPGSRRRKLPKRIIGSYAQYEHLIEIERLVKNDPELQAALGGDYQVDPDIFVVFEPLSDAELNAGGASLAAGSAAARSPIRATNRSKPKPILHASISCKWTMRRDRAQNIRLEALNLVRNRKGRLPHVTAVTMECDPGVLASLSLGTGDIDCVYHGALVELIDTAAEAADRYGGRWISPKDKLMRMVDGSRLRDIADLPLDLLI